MSGDEYLLWAISEGGQRFGTEMPAFREALLQSRSGIVYLPELEDLNFRCQLGGVPQLTDELLEANFSELERKRLNAKGVIYGIIAGMEAWKDSGLSIPESTDEEPRWDCGCIFGTGMTGVNTLREAIYKTDEKKVRKLGTTVVEQTMPSGISAFLGGRLGLGNWVTSNSSACSTGTESVIMAYERIKSGKARIILAGSCDADGPHVWGGFDSMRVLTYRHNDEPEKASRPMSASASGFVPGSGGGALVLESLDSALERGAPIYAEVIGGYTNSGGQRGTGTMTAPNSEGTQRCIQGALKDAAISPADIDLISGHLTSTMGDVLEVKNWSQALGLSGSDFPLINSVKSLTGHCLSAAGSIECVAAVLQLKEQFVHSSVNCEDLHPEIAECIDEK
ncbi:MAG: beta-ketoacyl-[acyl-carrier-protein] synthase family protein, partial [Owenweeksia sp.]